MEDMSGSDFLALLKEKKPEITASVPIVILSGEEPPTDCKMQANTVGFIQKFPDIDVFLEKVHYFLRVGTELLAAD
jgi:DNA-binding NarL/FixJ family response regulator